MRQQIASIVLTLPFLLAHTSGAKAQAIEPRLEAMDAIANAAIKVCDVAKASGNLKRDDIKAEVKAQLSGFAKFLASVGLTASGSHDVEQWVGPTQDQIPHVVEVISDCRLKATIEFKSFYAYLLTPVSVIAQSSPTPAISPPVAVTTAPPPVAVTAPSSPPPPPIAVTASPPPTPTFSPPVAVTAPPAPAPTISSRPPRPRPNTIVVCHGEFLAKCRAHPFNKFEQCSNSNGVGGANPAITGKQLCGNDQFTLKSAGPSVSGNHCGYAWFEVACQ